MFVCLCNVTLLEQYNWQHVRDVARALIVLAPVKRQSICVIIIICQKGVNDVFAGGAISTHIQQAAHVRQHLNGSTCDRPTSAWPLSIKVFKHLHVMQISVCVRVRASTARRRQQQKVIEVSSRIPSNRECSIIMIILPVL